MGLLDIYRQARQQFRDVVPQNVRSVARWTQLPWYAEQAVGSVIPGPGQTGGDYIFAQPQTGGDTTEGNATTTSDQQYTYNTSGGTGTPRESDWASVNGVDYDLNDPGQFQAYVAAAEGQLNRAFDLFKSQAERVRDVDIEKARAQEEEVIFNIDRALKKVAKQQGQYEEDYKQSLADLAEGFRQGTAKRQAFYAAIAPRVYQSSQGTSQQYAEGKYKEGQTRYAKERAKAMNEFAETTSDYKRQRTGAINAFGLYEKERRAQTEDELANKALATRQSLDELRGRSKKYASDMANLGGSQSNAWGGVSFAEKDLNYSPSQVNLNDLMQFIKFQPAGASSGGTSNAYATQAIATPKAGGESLGNYMGYQEQPTEPSTINAYKKGYGLY